ncbi:hypothetical protein [Thermobacillus sp.]|uniref:hypothetical protein n=1 Tax=Thermobacillus sp. TaxID=2108467 RepID=UPI00257AB5C9|nr:hypothetical protein [Thermobacillus sp.]
MKPPRDAKKQSSDGSGSSTGRPRPRVCSGRHCSRLTRYAPSAVKLTVNSMSTGYSYTAASCASISRRLQNAPGEQHADALAADEAAADLALRDPEDVRERKVAAAQLQQARFAAGEHPEQPHLAAADPVHVDQQLRRLAGARDRRERLGISDDGEAGHGFEFIQAGTGDAEEVADHQVGMPSVRQSNT